MSTHQAAGPGHRTDGPSPPDPAVAAMWMRLSVTLAFITGLVDIMAYLTLAKFFVTAISPSMILMASDLVRHVTPNAPLLLMVPTYLCGIVLAFFIARWLGIGSARMMRGLILTETVFFGCAFVVSLINPSPGHAGSIYTVLIGVLAILAVATQNAGMRMADPQAPTTWAMTAITVQCGIAALNSCFSHGAQRASALKQVRQIVPALIGWVLGGLIGTFATILARNWCWGIPFVTFAILLASIWKPTAKVEHQEAAPAPAKKPEVVQS